MNALINILKFLALLALAGTTVGVGLGSATGLSLAFGQSDTDWDMVSLALFGFIIMALLAWGVFALAKFFFASEADAIAALERQDRGTPGHFEA